MDAKARAAAETFALEILRGDVLLHDIEKFLKPWVVDEDKAEALKRSLENPDTVDFDAGVLVAAAMLREGEPLPDWLASFTADVLEGKRKRPTSRGPDPYAKWVRDYSVARAVIEVSNRFGVPKYTNSDTFDKVTAAQIVADAGQLTLDMVHHAIKKFGGKLKHIT